MTNETQNPKANTLLAYLAKNELPSLAKLREGDVVDAVVIKREPRSLFFSIGKLGTGIVYGVEMQNAKEIIKSLKVGDRVSAKIDSLDGEGGFIELSLSEADRQKGWQRAKTLEENGEIVGVKISAANQGGLIADLFGLKAFLPLSQLGPEHAISGSETDRQKIADALKLFIGQEFSVKVINANPRNSKLIVSERESTNPSANIKELLAKYTVGQTVQGLVSGIADFGIFVRFVDTPEIEGLVHISEIDYRIIDNPKEVVKLNEEVKVKIIDIKEGRVFLSLKALRQDPWEKVNELYKEGQAVRGKVYKFNPFGAIVDLEGGLQGMIHISEFESPEEMKKGLVAGELHAFTISAVKPEERRLILKLKK
jgi:small subunit ribosomal protein S1